MQEENFSEKESLKLIGEMISKAKRSYVEKGIASIVWGTLIIICSLLTWAKMQKIFDPGFDVWLLVFAAVIPQIFFSIKERRSKNFVSHTEQTMSYVWSAFGIAIFVLSFYNAKYGHDESSTLFMILYGIPTFITGGIFNFRPMLIGGLLCWIFSVVSVFTKPDIDMLLMAGCGLFAWLIPGIILWNRYQKQRRENV
jgi:hypothetical protein